MYLPIYSQFQVSEYVEFLMAMTRVFTVRDLNEEKYRQFRVLPIAMRRVLESMLQIKIWCNLKFVSMAIIEALIQASCYIPFVFIRGIYNFILVLLPLLSSNCITVHVETAHWVSAQK